jgi:uncharacterized protein (TIGR02246 family)
MLKRKVLIAVSLTVAALTMAMQGQQNSTKPSALAAQDILEIQQLVANYSFALDTGADNGYMYADLFTPDGTFGRTAGRENIAKMVRDGHQNSGWDHIMNLITNVAIQPSPEGATGKQYAVAIDTSKQPNVVYHTGHYQDVYVKTPAGWRFKSRTFTGHAGASQPAQSQPAR